MSERQSAELTVEERKRLKDRFGIKAQDDASLEEVVDQFRSDATKYP